jgi:hypothetical protein
MPEPLTVIALVAKWIAAHTATTAVAGATTAASGHIGAILFAGVVGGTTLFAICVCLVKLVEAGLFSQRQAEAYKERARNSNEAIKKEMYEDAKGLCEKYGL